MLFFQQELQPLATNKLFPLFFLKSIILLFNKNNLERDWHSQVIHSNKYKYKFNFILNFTIYLSGRQGRNLFTIFYINLSPFFSILINCDILSECNCESGRAFLFHLCECFLFFYFGQLPGIFLRKHMEVCTNGAHVKIATSEKTANLVGFESPKNNDKCEMSLT